MPSSSSKAPPLHKTVLPLSLKVCSIGWTSSSRSLLITRIAQTAKISLVAARPHTFQWLRPRLNSSIRTITSSFKWCTSINSTINRRSSSRLAFSTIALPVVWLAAWSHLLWRPNKTLKTPPLKQAPLRYQQRAVQLQTTMIRSCRYPGSMKLNQIYERILTLQQQQIWWLVMLELVSMTRASSPPRVPPTRSQAWLIWLIMGRLRAWSTRFARGENPKGLLPVVKNKSDQERMMMMWIRLKLWLGARAVQVVSWEHQ